MQHVQWTVNKNKNINVVPFPTRIRHLCSKKTTFSYIWTLITGGAGSVVVSAHPTGKPTVCQHAWRIASIRFNNVNLRPLILIPNMSGLLCPLLLNPGSRIASWMRANHYTTRASRNECSNVGACSLHATQVPNFCRKWHNIYILVLIHSPLYISHTTLRWVVNVLSFPSMPMQIEVVGSI